MSTTPNVPEPKEPSQYETSPTPHWIFVVFAILFVSVVYLLYAGQSEIGRAHV